jgi:5-methylcytosine-specific restriction endonuclease McrA
MEPSLKELVRRRARNACEYCRIPQDATPLISFHIEHIVSRQHGGSDAPATLALACDRCKCNAYKGPNLTSIDPHSNAVVPLFNPRQDMPALPRRRK